MESHAKAIRVAREIVGLEGATLAHAARAADAAAIASACDRLAIRIAEAILEARSQPMIEPERETIPHFALFMRAAH